MRYSAIEKSITNMYSIEVVILLRFNTTTSSHIRLKNIPITDDEYIGS